jgi:ribosomal protein S18 acetylase RimI-like enzyme
MPATLEFQRAGPQDAARVRELTRKAYAKWCQILGREPLGRRLVAHAEDETRRLGHGVIRLYTNKLFAANLSFYEGLGYEIEREAPFKGGTIVHFRKILA